MDNATSVFLVAVVTGLPATIAAVMGAINAWKLDRNHAQVNHRMDELLAAKEQIAFTAGEVQGAANVPIMVKVTAGATGPP